jgi:5'-nucleotidase
MHILLVNDDGIESPHLHMLCRAAAARGHHVLVCAPSTQQSGKSYSLTISTPLMVTPYEMEGAAAAWAVDGTPADCTHLAATALAEEPIDLCISGINHGYNAGLSIYASGTVSAARDAAFRGIRSMALSMEVSTPQETAHFFAEWAIRLGEHLAETDAPKQSVLNVNLPPVPIYNLQAPRFCPISTAMWSDGYEHRVSPRGKSYYWLNLYQDAAPDPESDIDLLEKGHITCTFIGPTGIENEGYESLLEDL